MGNKCKYYEDRRRMELMADCLLLADVEALAIVMFDDQLLLMKGVNVSALAELETRLRHGVPCKIPALRVLEMNTYKATDTIMSPMGGQNCPAVFDDGVT